MSDKPKLPSILEWERAIVCPRAVVAGAGVAIHQSARAGASLAKRPSRTRLLKHQKD